MNRGCDEIILNAGRTCCAGVAAVHRVLPARTGTWAPGGPLICPILRLHYLQHLTRPLFQQLWSDCYWCWLRTLPGLPKHTIHTYDRQPLVFLSPTLPESRHQNAPGLSEQTHSRGFRTAGRRYSYLQCGLVGRAYLQLDFAGLCLAICSSTAGRRCMRTGASRDVTK